MLHKTLLGLAIVLTSLLAVAQSGPTIVTGNDLKKVVPDTYFFRGLSATVQARNSAAVKYPDGMFVIAALVDTSGYSTDIKAKYSGLFITEKTLSMGGKTIAPGEYGMGYTPEGKFHILDVAANELAVADMTTDSKLAHPVPLKITVENGEVRLYQGKKYVRITAQ
jgi:hypothetical protein